MIETFWVLLGVGLVAYVLTAGADFGGGFWDLVARGPRRDQQRAAIEHAIAPIWEANHVWLIFMVVVLFTAFPRAFSALSVALHVPLTLALLGIVLRGSAFTFRAYGLQPTDTRARWGQVFAWASAATPLFLGAALAALATGDIVLQGGQVRSGFLAGWTTPFALLVGVFALTLFALLAAVYLAAETDGEVREDFRRRAIGAELVAGVVAAVVFARAAADAPELFDALAGSAWTLGVQAATAASALATITFLVRRHFRAARVTVALQVTLVVLGFGLAMDRHLILPALPLSEAGARPDVLEALLVPMAVGACVLAPSLWTLMVVFKARREAA